ncbi:Crp/Fnr family transcriptional regulator [Aureispira anguillae]|uniref:Crp/Fnr family transcriptional regulator n=1 Tax=Aureispira anguillae TaxID=2864201 RepID=A0A915YB67_9BACT|nr:Crp/Fnr family transcriptional regulator [Aureispira anguillae]BDS09860.1 Crp/Fnr family transcriptional regulator [Aureispira anguillae]
MNDEIIDYLSEHILLTEEEKNIIRNAITIKNFPKGALLLKEQQTLHASYFVVKGCIRRYYLVDGEEKTTHFYTEGQSILTHSQQQQAVPSTYYLACVEPSSLAVCTGEKEAMLFEGNPRLESLSRLLTEQDLIHNEETFATFVRSSPTERYINLLKNRPELLDRVPQYQLASYLGVKPETLSRIKKRIAQRGIK